MRKLLAVCAMAFASFWSAAQTAGPLDLNTATTAQLMTLPGMGKAYAKRIVDGRPYAMKNQLVQRGVLPQAAYDKIKEMIVARHVSKAK